MRSRARSTLLVSVVLGTFSVSGCSDPDPRLVAELEALDSAFYLPDLRGADLVDLHVDGELAVADVSDLPGASLQQGVATVDDVGGRSLCRQFAWTYLADSECREDGEDAWIADFEEMTTVGTVRDDGTLLVLRGLVTEADRTLAQDALAALREAPEVTARELAEAVPGFEDG